ncbi:hypothetical protein BDF19DRAFT_446979 [Syncephalis fuscata]|nr:hypothetical protein BDF19DRAFT_446979 [Syncephalis fuscata]
MSYIARWTVSLFGLINFIGLVLMHKASIIPYLACLMNVDTTTLHHWSTTLFPSKIYYAYSLFQWNGYADIIAVIICTVGLEIRAWSMRELGRFFTFKLGVSKDQRVVQSGPYHFVRHPSYTGALLVVYSVTYLLIIPTVREFVLPLVLSILELNIQYFDYNRSITQTVSILIELLRDPSTYQILELFMFALMVFMSVLTVTAIRIPQEEKMLSDSFGKEWDKFAATRARLIPYLY